MNSAFAERCLTTWLRRQWSGKRDLNPQHQPWQGCALPLSYSRSWHKDNRNCLFCQEAPDLLQRMNMRALRSRTDRVSGFYLQVGCSRIPNSGGRTGRPFSFNAVPMVRADKNQALVWAAENILQKSEAYGGNPFQVQADPEGIAAAQRRLVVQLRPHDHQKNLFSASGG